MSITADKLPDLARSRETEGPPAGDTFSRASEYVARHREHKARIAVYDAVVSGHWNTIWPDGTTTQSMPKIANHVPGDVVDLANLVGGPEPGIAVPQVNDEPRNLKNALLRQQVLYTYRKENRLKRLRKKTAIDLVSTGLACWVIWPHYGDDPLRSYPRYIRKDPRIVYPDPNLTDPNEVSSLVIRYITKARLVAAAYPQVATQLFTEHERTQGALSTSDLEVVEFYDKNGCHKVAHRAARDGRYKSRTVTLAYVRNFLGSPLALIAAPESADGQFRGQFDESIPPLDTANKMMEMHIADMADRIFAEKIVMGQWDNPEDAGPGATLYTSDYQAKIDRAQPANSSQQLYQDISLLMQSSREAGGVPPARVGNVDQNIISGTGITALQGKLVTNVSAYQDVLGDLEERANALALQVDEIYMEAEGKILSGIAGGRSFNGAYTPSRDIAGQYENRVAYGPGAAVDSYNRSVQAFQKLEYGTISKRKAMEQDGDVEDVAAMESEIAKELVLSGFIAGLSAPETDLLTRAKAASLMAQGKTVEEVAQMFAVEMAAAQEQAAAVEEVVGPEPGAAAEEPQVSLPPLPVRRY